MNFSFKKVLKLFFNILPANIKSRLVPIFGLKNPLELYKSLKRYNTSLGEVNKKQKRFCDLDIWVNAFKRNIWSEPNNVDIAISFLTSEVKQLKKVKISSEKDVILICVVKNDLKRMKMFYDHYRKNGIKHFVIIDNNSNDGTREWLLQQPDSDVYLAKEKFFSKRKYGWINKIISYYGFDRWYLYADSDELFIFHDIENHSIQDLIHYADNRKEKRIAALMLDMYSDQVLFKQESDKDIREEYIYFDRDSYLVNRGLKGMDIRGGPRKRVFESEPHWEGPLLIKHPLFYFEEGNIFESAHYIFPFENNSLLVGALLHYKFIETDLNRYRNIAKLGNFSQGSREYKQYIKSFESNNDLTFMYEGSTKFYDSSSLQKISFMQKINWDEYDKRDSGEHDEKYNT